MTMRLESESWPMSFINLLVHFAKRRVIRMKFSIVIPVYNAEKYIDECIKKCIGQDYADFEIILVINGSHDQSENICNSWTRRDDRIRVISLDTAGVSNARNVGIAASKGEWIIFVDSDDYLLPGALKTIDDNIEDDVDMICFNYEQKNLHRSLTGKKKILSAKAYLLAMLDPASYFSDTDSLTWRADVLGVNWSKAFRRKVIENEAIKFKNNITIFEDLLFNLDFMKSADVVKCVDVPVYYYTVNDDSLSRTSSIERIRQRLDYIEELKKYIDGEQDLQVKHAIMFQAGQNLLRTFVVAARNEDNQDMAMKTMMEYLQRSSTKHLLLELRNTRLSLGKVQNIFFIVLLRLLRLGLYRTSFVMARCYAKNKKKG